MAYVYPYYNWVYSIAIIIIPKQKQQRTKVLGYVFGNCSSKSLRRNEHFVQRTVLPGPSGPLICQVPRETFGPGQHDTQGTWWVLVRRCGLGILQENGESFFKRILRKMVSTFHEWKRSGCNENIHNTKCIHSSRIFRL